MSGRAGAESKAYEVGGSRRQVLTLRSKIDGNTIVATSTPSRPALRPLRWADDPGCNLAGDQAGLPRVPSAASGRAIAGSPCRRPSRPTLHSDGTRKRMPEATTPRTPRPHQPPPMTCPRCSKPVPPTTTASSPNAEHAWAFRPPSRHDSVVAAPSPPPAPSTRTLPPGTLLRDRYRISPCFGNAAWAGSLPAPTI